MSMPSDRSSSDRVNLFARARAGDQAAWTELFDTCYPKVVRAVRANLGRMGPYNGRILRSIYDSTDIASDVMKSLAAKSDRFEFESVDDLMHFLTHAAQQRVIDEYRKMHAKKREEFRKVSIHKPDGGLYDTPAGDPTASQQAQAREAGDRIEAGLSEQIRRLIRMKRDEELSNQEAADRLGWDVRKVQRVLQAIKEQWERKQGQGARA